MTLLPETLVEPLKQHLLRVREEHERALGEGCWGTKMSAPAQIYTHVLKLNGFAV